LAHPKILAWRDWRPYARPLAGFKGAASWRGSGGEGRERGRGTEREKRNRKEEKVEGMKAGTGPPIG